MKKLGFGCMRLPLIKKGDDSTVDKKYAAEMFDSFLGAGFTYFDTAFMYHKSMSERVVGEMLCSRHEREKFLLATKMPVGMLKGKEDTDRIFSEQKEKCCTDYFDYYLLHCLDKNNYKKALKYGVFENLQKKKENGEIKKLGFSFHDTADVLDKILTEQPQMEFVQLQINYLDWEDIRVQSRRCYETARKHGKEIIVMEPVKGGRLANLTPEAKAYLEKYKPGISPACFALGFCASLPGVSLVLSGMSDRHQLKENMEYFDNLDSFSEKDFEIARDIAKILKKQNLIDCTACQYCVEGCPKKIDIPKYFAVYNDAVKGKITSRRKYRALTKKTTPPSECIACGKCEKTCPQKINIIESLKNTMEKFK